LVNFTADIQCSFYPHSIKLINSKYKNI